MSSQTHPPIEVMWRKVEHINSLLGDASEVEAYLKEQGHDTVLDWIETVEGDADANDRAASPDGQLASRVSRLEQATGLDDDDGDDQSPDTDWPRRKKIIWVRAKAYKRATKRQGKGSYNYKDVRTLFDEDISDGHCYDLLRAAAEYDADTGRSQFPGFEYDEDGGEMKRLLVDADATRDDAAFHAVNNEDGSEGVK